MKDTYECQSVGRSLLRLNLFSNGPFCHDRDSFNREDPFITAYNEDPYAAILYLFYHRDAARGCDGSRDGFRNMLSSVLFSPKCVNPEIILDFLEFVPLYGRWDDLIIPALIDPLNKWEEGSMPYKAYHKIRQIMIDQIESDLHFVPPDEARDWIRDYFLNRLAKPTDTDSRKASKTMRTFLKSLGLRMESMSDKVNSFAAPNEGTPIKFGESETEVSLSITKSGDSSDLKGLFNHDDGCISLLGKWLPSVNTSSAYTRELGRHMARFLGLSERGYRKICSLLRKQIRTVESRLSQPDNEPIDINQVPHYAQKKYERALLRRNLFPNESNNRTSYIRSLEFIHELDTIYEGKEYHLNPKVSKTVLDRCDEICSNASHNTVVMVNYDGATAFRKISTRTGAINNHDFIFNWVALFGEMVDNKDQHRSVMIPDKKHVVKKITYRPGRANPKRHPEPMLHYGRILPRIINLSSMHKLKSPDMFLSAIQRIIYSFCDTSKPVTILVMLYDELDHDFLDEFSDLYSGWAPSSNHLRLVFWYPSADITDDANIMVRLEHAKYNNIAGHRVYDKSNTLIWYLRGAMPDICYMIHTGSYDISAYLKMKLNSNRYEPIRSKISELKQQTAVENIE